MNIKMTNAALSGKQSVCEGKILGKCDKNTKLTRNDFDASPPITMLVCFLLQQLREMSRGLPVNRSTRFWPF
jgi:hypothetical protein